MFSIGTQKDPQDDLASDSRSAGATELLITVKLVDPNGNVQVHTRGFDADEFDKLNARVEVHSLWRSAVTAMERG